MAFRPLAKTAPELTGTIKGSSLSGKSSVCFATKGLSSKTSVAAFAAAATQTGSVKPSELEKKSTIKLTSTS